ncbi:MAG: acetyl-CoA carboxylase biotin carboxyl carrier protein [Candidatus Eremiobacteraeota bacterium]|nr:acetyl-CoA carboxylase biotin carboxyl carrier protein [Candidatus Eremiobacteraeota bacterium]MBV8655639.1 acetyl-CoA carboxylase biotin carboxyl carrier protein [Candidatus Eremiobacteraeota bacterium]
MMERDPETETLEELLELMHEHDLDRLKVKRGDAVYEIVRREASAPSVAVTPAAVTAPAAAETETAPAPSSHAKRILAPLTGVFYRSASPDAEAFVDVGDRIEAGDVVCILEAMKLFNEIQSDYSGTVSRIVPENGELVSQGEDLFWIEP